MGVIIKLKYWVVSIPIILTNRSIPKVLARLFSLAGCCYYFIRHNRSWGGSHSLTSQSLITRSADRHSSSVFTACEIILVVQSAELGSGGLVIGLAGNQALKT